MHIFIFLKHVKCGKRAKAAGERRCSSGALAKRERGGRRGRGENSEGGGGSSAIDVREGARPIAGAECYEMPPLDARFRHFL